MDPKLATEASNYRLLREQLRGEFSDIDDETLTDTLEGLSNLPDLLAAVLRSALDDRDLAEALRGRVKTMQGRLSRIEVRANRKRDVVRAAMETTGLKRLVQPDFSATLQNSQPPVVVTDEGAIPTEFWVPQPARLDRQKLREMLRSGATVPGAVLGNQALTISVRTG